MENYKEINNFTEFKDNNIIRSKYCRNCTKFQEKKTQKGNSYAIIKFSDRQSVFELFIFSDLLEMNREFLKEGLSLIITQ